MQCGNERLVRGRPVVACLDDEPAILDAVARLLRREPYELVTTTSAAELWRWLEAQAVHLVLVDERMPGASGTELLERIRARWPRVSRVMLTGYPHAAPLVSSERRGLCVCIAKPWDDDELKRVIRRLLRLQPMPP